MYDPKKAFVTENNHVIYPEKDIDIFDVYEGEYDHSILDIRDIEPYTKVSKLVIDIETTGTLEDAENGKVYMIGLMNENGLPIVLVNKNEKQLLIDFLKILQTKKPAIITGYNIFSYDLPYLEVRFIANDLAFPFTRSQKLTIHRTAVQFNKPSEFYPYYADYSIGHGSIVDLYYQTLALDFVIRKLTSYRLKSVVLELGLRKEPRLDLPYQVMMQHYNNWIDNDEPLTDMIEYLIYDLEDTYLLMNRLLPSIYYQTRFIDWNIQSIAYGGNASKWNSILSSYYCHEPIAQSRKTIDGGYTLANPGLYGDLGKNIKVCQIDFTSLYPNIMLRNKVYSHRKDPDMVLLSYLDYQTKERVSLKHKFKSTGDINADYAQQSAKPFINSAYGVCGTAEIPYNDYGCAAFITSYGRKICKFVQTVINSNNARVVQVDTDGLVFYTHADNTQNIFDIVHQKLPKGFAMEMDFVADSIYIPADDDGNGVKKNYIIFNEGKVKKKTGILWNKRNLCNLEKNYTIEYLLSLIYKGSNEAQAYYETLINEIKNCKIDLELIKISRNVAKSEKTLHELGLVFNTGDGNRTTYYTGYGTKTYKRKPKKYSKYIELGKNNYVVEIPQKVNQGPYHVDSYIEMVEKLTNKICESINKGLELM